MKQVIIGVASALLIVAAVGDSMGQAMPGVATTAGAERWTPAQLEQLVAPIALYPDSLLGAILAASTYPLEVVEAARWLDDPDRAALTGDALAGALEAQRWDPSVKSLVPFPAVLRQMDSDLEWTEQLGDAFLAEQGAVMDAVQRLRQRAAAQGALESSPQQTVTTEQGTIAIEPANPDLVYVPYYVPAIYGPWPWPGYPPYDFGVPPGVFIGGALIGFGVGIGFFEPWGWYGCNWRGHGIEYRPPRPGRPGERPGERSPDPRPPPQPWHHDPLHRDGVPYRDAATAARYTRGQGAGRHEFRGFAPTATPARSPQPAPSPGPRERLPAPNAPMRVPPPSYGRPATPAPAPVPRAAPPAFESFGRGPQVRNEAARGSFSRSAPAAPAGGSGGHPGHR